MSTRGDWSFSETSTEQIALLDEHRSCAGCYSYLYRWKLSHVSLSRDLDLSTEQITFSILTAIHAYQGLQQLSLLRRGIAVNQLLAISAGLVNGFEIIC